MFASLLLIAAAAMQGVPIVTVPLQKPPPRVERPVAPIEEAGPAFAQACKDNTDWNTPAPPVRIHGNTYLVGTCGISVVLITGSDGHIVIDSGTEAGAELVAENIRSLGFRLRDVKYLLHSHEHIDHVGGMARLKQLTGAELVASAPAASVFRTGAAAPSDPQAGMHPPFPAVSVDRVIKDGDFVQIGNLRLKAIDTRGHTQGALSWTWVSCDGGVCPTLVFADSLTPVSRKDYRFSDHPAVVKSFRTSIAKVGALECDILLTGHPSASDMVNRMAGRAPLKNGKACADYAAALTKRLDDRLAEEAAAK